MAGFDFDSKETMQAEGRRKSATPQPQSGPKNGARAVQIVKPGPEHTFVLDEDALSELLLQNDVKDKHVVVVSVAGAFRKGKSFLLDFFLRFMNHKYLLNESGSEWLGGEETPLDGFSWRGGSERDTTGILMWSHIFKATLPSGEEVAVILLDTQGAFDSKSTVRDCATVFALTTMLSSVQIYNLSQNIQENDLQHLQLFTEYGRLALADSGRKPFQRLQFLVRDWSFPYEATYGAEGGQEILSRRLELSEEQHPELQSLRRHITSCFEEIACFLMPHPGLKVATNPNFDGRLADIESEFKKSLQKLVPMLLSPSNLVPKMINGQRVRARDLLLYFKAYMNIYKGNELPEPKSMLVATAEANNLTAMAEAKEVYTTLMEELCGGSKPYMQPTQLERQHARVRDKALHAFHARRKMGGEEFSTSYRDQLTKELEDQFGSYKENNESKNIMNMARTPIVLGVVVVLAYVLSGVFGLLSIYPMANMCNLMMSVTLLTMVLWAYIRYSGEMSEVGEKIDFIASWIYENRLRLYDVLMEKDLDMAEGGARGEGATQSSGTASSSVAATSNGKLKAL